MTEENKFEKAAAEVAKKEVVQDTTKPIINSVRKQIDETTVSDTSWVKFPSAEHVGESTPELQISEYYQEGPCKENNFLKAKNKNTGEEFYLGLDRKNETDEGDQFVIEGTVEGTKSTMRLNSWEQVFKMSKLVRYCKEMNFTLANQIISFKRVKFGQKNAGKNWELLVPSLKIKIVGAEDGKDNTIEKL